jgi:DNA-binding response OmpR family regulator
VRVDRMAAVLPIVRVVNPVAVLLDLDLPNHASWEIASALSNEKGGPPMVLFTGRTDQVHVETAISTGAVLDKSAGPGPLLEAADEVLGLSDSSRVRWNANQVELVRWLSPCRWSGPVTSTRRFWGVND